MADRLTIITTRTGDDGTTGLADGSRVAKTHPRIIALGEVDELNSQIGLVLAQLAELPKHEGLKPIRRGLQPVQHALFDIGSELAIPGHVQLKPEQLQHLDKQIAEFNATLPSLREFILPGGALAAAQMHVARSVCRRAERSLVALDTNPNAQCYLNRLSDLLFILARCVNQALGNPDVLWQKTT